MHGQPVWLASLSKRNLSLLRPDGEPRIVPTGEWPQWQRERYTRVLRNVLHGVGDPSRERLFRMCVTLCMHRACTEEEVDQLGPEWRSCRATALAGGPVEVIWQTVEETPSTLPCENVVRRPIDSYQPELWFPEDCGRCGPCLARLAIMRPENRVAV